MSCQYVKQRCDDYLDKSLSEVEIMIFNEHLSHCQACDEYVAQAWKTREALHNIAVPPMREGFAQDAIRHAIQKHENVQTKHYRGLGLALAASLVFIAMTGLYFNKPSVESTPAIVLGLNQTKNVKLLFDSKDDIDKAIEWLRNISKDKDYQLTLDDIEKEILPDDEI